MIFDLSQSRLRKMKGIQAIAIGICVINAVI